MKGHRIRTVVVVLGLACGVLAGCNQTKQQSILRANEGDTLVDSNPGDAIQKYEEAVKLDPTNHAILYKLAKAYRKKEDWEKVQSTLQRAVEKAPQFADYWFELGIAIETQAKKAQADKDKGGKAKWADAIEPFSKCIEKDPNFDHCYFHLGEAYYWTDDEQKAIQKMHEAIEHRPADSDVKPEPKKGDDPEKAKKLKSDREKCVDNAEMECALNRYARLGRLYTLLDYYKEAEQLLTAAREMADPKDKRLYVIFTLLADVYKEQKDIDKMVKTLEEARTLREDDAALLFNLGMAYAQTNPPKKAEALSRLKGFQQRACTKDAAKYKKECEQASTIVQRLSGAGG
jgi:tetratricopeptide (TPR) repeat protein